MSNGQRGEMWHLWELERNVILVPQPERKMNKNTVSEKLQPGMLYRWDGDAPTQGRPQRTSLKEAALPYRLFLVPLL